MNTLSLDTTQNITIEYPLAGLGDRVLATLIDIGIILAYALICLFAIFQLFNSSNGATELLLFIIYIPVMFYNLVSELTMHGQTFGKKAMGIRVMNLDGGSPRTSQYFIRWLFRLIDIYIGNGLVALLCVAISDKSQRLGDMVAGTIVVKLKSEKKIEHNLEQLQSTSSDYVVRYPEVANLSNSDIKLIKDTINVVNKTENTMLALELSNKIEQKTGAHRQEEPLYFLKTVLNDYQHLH